MSYAVVESMRRLVLGNGSVIRIWRDRTGQPLEFYHDDPDIMALASQMNPMGTTGAVTLMEAIAELPGVNAVELVDTMGNGLVVYTNW